MFANVKCTINKLREGKLIGQFESLDIYVWLHKERDTVIN